MKDLISNKSQDRDMAITQIFELDDEHKKLVKEFGSRYNKDLKQIPDFYTFKKGLIFSHRDFDEYFKALNSKKKCAIVSGLNPSATLHLGHKVVFDTNLFFQKKYGVDVFIPLSDDESYVARKIETQEEGLKNAIRLAKELLAYGFNPKKTFFIIDQKCTPIYNLAIKFSRQVTLSMAKAVYGFTDDSNIGLTFYPAVQAAHVLYPMTVGYHHSLTPISIDEDAHLRIARDIAPKFGLKKCAVVHSMFMPGLDGLKMSASRPHTAIFFSDSPEEVKRKVARAESGGRATLDEHRKKGGIPEKDMAFKYLAAYFLDEKQTAKLEKDYRSGKLLSSELKAMLVKHINNYLADFHKKLKSLKDKDVYKCLLFAK